MPTPRCWCGTFNITPNGATPPNWTNTGTLAPDSFYNGDSVAFDDTGSTNPAVNLTGTLLPGSISVNSANNYRFAGTGGIGGFGTLTKTETP